MTWFKKLFAQDYGDGSSGDDFLDVQDGSETNQNGINTTELSNGEGQGDVPDFGKLNHPSTPDGESATQNSDYTNQGRYEHDTDDSARYTTMPFSEDGVDDNHNNNLTAGLLTLMAGSNSCLKCSQPTSGKHLCGSCIDNMITTQRQTTLGDTRKVARQGEEADFFTSNVTGGPADSPQHDGYHDEELQRDQEGVKSTTNNFDTSTKTDNSIFQDPGIVREDNDDQDIAEINKGRVAKLNSIWAQFNNSKFDGVDEPITSLNKQLLENEVVKIAREFDRNRFDEINTEPFDRNKHMGGPFGGRMKPEEKTPPVSYVDRNRVKPAYSNPTEPLTKTPFGNDFSYQDIKEKAPSFVDQTYGDSGKSRFQEKAPAEMIGLDDQFSDSFNKTLDDAAKTPEILRGKPSKMHRFNMLELMKKSEYSWGDNSNVQQYYDPDEVQNDKIKKGKDYGTGDISSNDNQSNAPLDDGTNPDAKNYSGIEPTASMLDIIMRKADYGGVMPSVNPNSGRDDDDEYEVRPTMGDGQQIDVMDTGKQEFNTTQNMDDKEFNDPSYYRQRRIKYDNTNRAGDDTEDYFNLSGSGQGGMGMESDGQNFSGVNNV